MEKPKLFGDVYDIISCYVLIVMGIGIFIYSFINNHKGFLYGGSTLIGVFGGLLFFSYYARYKNKFTEFNADLKSIIVSVFVVFLIISTLVIINILIG
ncbi:hypothetical protein HOE37_00365 [Candidatus Woesearchaeota archaeon]|jgi:hypothetical protein|nr:hypothetical protein [Candidatus Woesearchaeota archaeon]MBT4110289.1 hypothetical protein [Candidatus Woesearchaeota archaeon]MBT4336187.1 hypothetical protein [Candidatus Woesearchaeota archaeon]MBT4468834.1 hypothetical protein [Candidatus Woesearchaeota archaeon]MBT6744847.1 hypothetical protein [Candidatus Woesearchaeota archaeon]